MAGSPDKARFAPRIMSFRDLASAGADFPELVKSRLTTLVLLTTAGGFCLGWQPGTSLLLLLHVLLGTSGVAAGAAVLNELLEMVPDSKMARTRQRPLPAGRINPQDALFLGGLLSGLGLGYLLIAVNPLCAFLAGATLLIYLFIYTPMKRHSSWNTAVGAIPGALPPAIGWAGATQTVDLEALTLFGLQFLWQIPHFLGIAWLYRQDYEKAGFTMITLNDPQGRSTAGWSFFSTVLLFPATIGLFWFGQAGPLFLVGGLILAAIYLKLALAFIKTPGDPTAKKLFLYSLIYLPALYLIALLDNGLFQFRLR